MSISIQGRTGWGAFPYTIGRSRLPHATFHLLFNLLTHAEGFNATYSIITEQTGMSSKTIANALDNLKKLDLITVSKKKGKNGRFDSNHYTFHADRLWQITPEFVDERLRGKPTVEGKAGEGDRFTRESGTALQGKVAPLYKGKTKEDQGERSVEENQSPLTPKGEDRFLEFYDVYDRKKKRPDAERAWKKAIKKADPQVIIDAAKAFIATQRVANKHPQYTPYPATWLNAESWNDEIDDWQGPSSWPQQPTQSGNTLAAWGAPSAHQSDPFDLASQDPFANMRHIIDHEEDDQ